MPEKNIFVTSGRPLTPSSTSDYSSLSGLELRYTRPSPGVELVYQSITDEAEQNLYNSNQATNKYFSDATKNLPQKAEKKLSDIESSTTANSGSQANKAHLIAYSITKLLLDNTDAYQAQIKIAKAYDGADPSIGGFRYPPVSFGPEFLFSVEQWKLSYRAAFDARLLVMENDILYARLITVNAMITSAQADAAALIAAQSESHTQRLKDAQEQVRLKQYPSAPPDVSVDKNLDEAKKQDQFYPTSGSAHLYTWFYTKVRNRGSWDYKQHGAQYESFGNFHYGAVGTAAGIPEAVLLRAAGAAQTVAGTSLADFGKWWLDEPYGDDPVDQVWIKAGIDYAKTKGY